VGQSVQYDLDRRTALRGAAGLEALAHAPDFLAELANPIAGSPDVLGRPEQPLAD